MNKTFLDACFSKKSEYTPVWYMRQAGRYLPQYRKLKEKYKILEICQTPELAVQVALQPVDILHVDAAILFADIMIPLLGIGVDLDIVESIGPVIHNPIKSLIDVQKLRELHPKEDVPYLLETIKLLRNELRHSVPLIGFSAAPFTLASYLIEGRPTRDFIKTKSFMYNNEKAWHLLMNKLSKMIITYLHSQINKGAHAIQLFDSWVGCLNEIDYKEFVLPYSAKIFQEITTPNIPLIHFGTNTASILSPFSSVDCDVISIDWRISVSKAWKEIGFKKAIQGNLDPVLLLSDFSRVKKRVDELYLDLPKRNGFIFNLGHGVLQTTPVENLIQLTDYIHEK